jgi:hypothetical protein
VSFTIAALVKKGFPLGSYSAMLPDYRKSYGSKLAIQSHQRQSRYQQDLALHQDPCLLRVP